MTTTTTTTRHVIEGAALLQAIPAVTLPQLIRERARQHLDDIALVDAASGRSSTYGEVDLLIGRCAGLQAGRCAGDLCTQQHRLADCRAGRDGSGRCGQRCQPDVPGR